MGQLPGLDVRKVTHVRHPVSSPYASSPSTTLHIHPTTASPFILNIMSTTISAPGKVLIAGGYLVLDPAYSGVVIATSSRFYTTIFNTPNSTSNETNQSRIRVSSPQFEDATWEYSLNTSSKSFVTPISGGRNKFVELALDKTLKLIKAIKRSRGESTDELTRGLQIVIVGDNDFYSQRKEVSTSHSLSFEPSPTSSHNPVSLAFSWTTSPSRQRLHLSPPFLLSTPPIPPLEKYTKLD